MQDVIIFSKIYFIEFWLKKLRIRLVYYFNWSINRSFYGMWKKISTLLCYDFVNFRPIGVKCKQRLRSEDIWGFVLFFGWIFSLCLNKILLHNKFSFCYWVICYLWSSKVELFLEYVQNFVHVCTQLVKQIIVICQGNEA